MQLALWPPKSSVMSIRRPMLDALVTEDIIRRGWRRRSSASPWTSPLTGIKVDGDEIIARLATTLRQVAADHGGLSQIFQETSVLSRNSRSGLSHLCCLPVRISETRACAIGWMAFSEEGDSMIRLYGFGRALGNRNLSLS